MAYAIYIERVNKNGESIGEPITLSEWKAAIGKLDNIRLATEDAVMTNPSTGDVIRIPHSDGDAEIFFPEESKWSRVYHWQNGRISFKGLLRFDNPNDVMRQTTLLLAKVLDARIIGDGGEVYD